MEWVLRSDSEVRVLLLNTQYLPTSKTMLIDLKLGILKNAETFCGHGRLDVVVATYSETFVSMDHFASDAGQCYMDPCLIPPVLEFYFIPDTRPKLVFSYLSQP